jgi:hypothetical protein
VCYPVHSAGFWSDVLAEAAAAAPQNPSDAAFAHCDFAITQQRSPVDGDIELADALQVNSTIGPVPPPPNVPPRGRLLSRHGTLEQDMMPILAGYSRGRPP